MKRVRNLRKVDLSPTSISFTAWQSQQRARQAGRLRASKDQIRQRALADGLRLKPIDGST